MAHIRLVRLVSRTRFVVVFWPTIPISYYFVVIYYRLHLRFNKVILLLLFFKFYFHFSNMKIEFEKHKTSVSYDVLWQIFIFFIFF